MEIGKNGKLINHLSPFMLSVLLKIDYSRHSECRVQAFELMISSNHNSIEMKTNHTQQIDAVEFCYSKCKIVKMFDIRKLSSSSERERESESLHATLSHPLSRSWGQRTNELTVRNMISLDTRSGKEHSGARLSD